MTETLLRSNRRAALVLCLVAAIPCCFGVLLVVWGQRTPSTIISWIGALLLIGGAWLLWRQLVLMIPPRLALGHDHLLVFLRGLVPWRVPLEVVECFFIGQAPTQVQVANPTGGRVENVTVVVRLAERAGAWRQRKVRPALGKWCDGYITVFGVWCEPLDGDVVNRMNHRLAEVKRVRRQQGQVNR